MSKLWSKRKYKRVDVNHPLLNNLPKQSSDDVIQTLLVRVRQGDEAACQEMITEHMLLVKLKIQDFLGDYPHLKKELDELVSVGILACVEAVHRVKNGSMTDHDNITGYIRVAIWRFLGEWVDTHLMDASKQRPLPSQPDSDLIEHPKAWNHEGEATMECLASVDNQRCFEIVDVLEALNLTEEEWFIIESRMVGDTNDEIAEQLDVTEFTIRFILGDIQRRFLEKYEDDDV